VLAMAVALTDGGIQSAAVPTDPEADDVLVIVAAAGAAMAISHTVASATVRRRAGCQKTRAGRRAARRAGGVGAGGVGIRADRRRPGSQMAASRASSSRAGATWTVRWRTVGDRRNRIAVPAKGTTATRRQARSPS